MDRIFALGAHLQYEAHDAGLHDEEQHILCMRPSLRQTKVGHELAVGPRIHDLNDS